MDDRKWRRVKEIFLRAIERPSGERSVLIEEACGGDPDLRAKVEDFVNAHEQAGPDPSDGALAPLVGGGEGPGAVIGRYKLLQKIGEGGFGTVYMAEQTEPVNRRVALKIVKLGMDTRQVIARFEAERQALALMDHPSIARVLDAGATDSGRPYFVMELVKGVPITEYCDQASLDTAERLALFQEVCHAVQHAHQKGIIHRDIKPSNVMVTLHDGRPVPKVIDFGIAKATDRKLTQKTLFTEFRQMVGTPEYMAPEQAEMSGLDVDTRADIYSLGVLLYELLTGTQPFDMKSLLAKGYDEILRTIREVDPPKPSTRVSTMGEELSVVAGRRHTQPKLLGRLLRGDLDWIVMKTLAKDRSRRYESAGALVEDIGRYLSDRPVVAGPPGRAYRVRKYVRRHRVGVLATAAVLLALVVGGVLAAVAYLEATRQRDLAEEARREAVAKQEEAQLEASIAYSHDSFIRHLLTSADLGDTRAEDYTVRQLLEDYERKLDELEDPRSEAQVRLQLAYGYQHVQLPVRAERHVRTALDIYRRIRGEEAEFSACLYVLAHVLENQGRYVEAEAAARRSLDIKRGLPGDRRRGLVLTLGILSSSEQQLARYDGAEEHAREALSISRELYGERHRETAARLSGVANVLWARGDHGGAAALHRQALSILRETWGEDHPDVLITKLRLAHSLVFAGENAAAEPLLEDVIAVYRRTCGEEDPRMAWALNGRGLLLEEKGDLAGAEEYRRKAVAIQRSRLGNEHPLVAATLTELGRVLNKRCRHTEAERVVQESLAIRRKTLGDGHPAVAKTLTVLGQVMVEKGEHAEAEDAYREALEIQRRALDAGHPDTTETLVALGGCLMSRGDLDGSERILREALELRRERLGPRHPRVAQVLQHLGWTLCEKESLADAEQAALEALAILREAPGEFAQLAGSCLNGLCVLSLRRKDFGAAEEFALQALAFSSKTRGGENLDVATHKGNLARALIALNRQAEAEKLFREILALKLQLRGEDHPDTAGTMTTLAELLMDRDAYEEAAGLHRRALAVRRVRLGEEHGLVFQSLEGLGNALMEKGAHEEAEPYLTEALALSRRIRGEDHRDTSAAHHNLGTLLRRMGDLDAAEEHLRAALATHREDSSLSCLAGLLQERAKQLAQKRDLDAAERCYREVLAILRELHDGDHEQTVVALCDLGHLFQRKRAPATAEPFLREALAMGRRLDLPLALPLSSHALALGQMGRHDEAEPLFRESLTLLTQPGSPDSVQLAWCRLGLGEALRSRGDFAEAEPLFREALAGFRKHLGDRHPQTLATMPSLAHCLMRRGDIAGLETLYREHVAALRKMHGNDHPLVAADLHILGHTVAKLGKFEETEELYREAHAIRTRIGANVEKDLLCYGAFLSKRDKPREAEPVLRQLLAIHRRGAATTTSLATVLVVLGLCLGEQDEFVEAESLLREALALLRGGAAGPITLDGGLAALGQCMFDQEKHAEAEPLLREALAMRERTERGSWLWCNAMSLLGGSLAGLSRYAEAEPLLLESYAKMAPPPELVSRKAQALRRIVDLYEDWGKLEKAAAWRARLPKKR